MPTIRRPIELAPRTRLTLRTLGSAALLRSSSNSAPDEIIPLVGKQFALLAYLACANGRAVRRAYLSTLFAPRPLADGDEGTDGRAADAVRNIIQQLRSKLGPDAFGSPRSDPLPLTIALTSDRDELLAAWDRHDYRAVVALYVGEFLPQVTQIGACFGDCSGWGG